MTLTVHLRQMKSCGDDCLQTHPYAMAAAVGSLMIRSTCTHPCYLIKYRDSGLPTAQRIRHVRACCNRCKSLTTGSVFSSSERFCSPYPACSTSGYAGVTSGAQAPFTISDGM